MKKTPLLDVSAIGLSGLCLVHCLAPALLVVLGLRLMPIAESAAVHPLLLGMALPIGVAAFSAGFRRHADRRVMALGLAGFALMGLGIAVGHGGSAETLLTVAGVTLLACAHALNWKTLKV
jgi:MerC mercury resistance protein